MTETLEPVMLDLNQCDREPIHIPQSIQPHGFMLVLDLETLTLRLGAGPIEELTGRTITSPDDRLLLTLALVRSGHWDDAVEQVGRATRTSASAP